MSAIRNRLILLFLLCPAICLGKSPDHIRSIAVSPDGKIIAVDFEKGVSWLSLKWRSNVLR